MNDTFCRGAWDNGCTDIMYMTIEYPNYPIISLLTQPTGNCVNVLRKLENINIPYLLLQKMQNYCRLLFCCDNLPLSLAIYKKLGDNNKKDGPEHNDMLFLSRSISIT